MNIINACPNGIEVFYRCPSCNCGNFESHRIAPNALVPTETCPDCGNPEVECYTKYPNVKFCEVREAFILKDENTGVKDDYDKPQYNLIVPEFTEGLAKVLTAGAKKYAPNNWMQVENKEQRYYDALMRHLEAIRKGEMIDPESGFHHIYHVACNVMFLSWFYEQDKDFGTTEESEFKKKMTKEINDAFEVLFGQPTVVELLNGVHFPFYKGKRYKVSFMAGDMTLDFIGKFARYIYDDNVIAFIDEKGEGTFFRVPIVTDIEEVKEDA